jgi:creatinine amidohydrolase
MNQSTGTKEARPYILAETNWKTVRETEFRVAVLPWGATEAHNYHLPYATDNYQVDHVAAEAAGMAWEQGARVIVLPCIPFGINTGQMDIDLCMNMLPTTQLAILRDVADVLQRAGISKLVILNGHGGNTFKTMIRQLSFDFPGLFTCSVNWYQVVNWNEYFEDPGDHAGEMETSAMMYIAPQFVRPLEEAGPGEARQPVIRAMREGWVTTQRPWSQVTNDTGVGSPYLATAEKGARYLAACAAGLADFFVDLAKTEVKAMYR